ncbi:MAG: NUDIX hydrolase [Cytophagaceae bacterium]
MDKAIKSLSIDCVIFGYEDTELKVLLIKRKKEPEQGMWALPGGFILEDEDLNESAQRILLELTGVKGVFMDQVKTFGEVKRYPLRRVITIVYYALIKSDVYKIKAGALATDAKWFSIKKTPELPFDHPAILAESLTMLQNKLRQEPVGFELLPDKFSLTQLQQLYEAILDTTLDKRNFRKKLLKMKLLIQLSEIQKGVAHRAAKLYKFDPKIYAMLKKKGFVFEL